VDIPAEQHSIILYIDDRPQNVKSYCVDDLISDGNRFPFIKNRTVITVKICQSKGVLIRFGSQIFLVLRFSMKRKIGFQIKRETDILPLVIIEAIQV
jgi:hypothetical protein